MLEAGTVEQEATTEQDDSDVPRGFFKLVKNDVPYYIRKSSILWMLFSRSLRIPTDRLHRFVTGSKKTLTYQQEGGAIIECGDFVTVRVRKEGTSTSSNTSKDRNYFVDQNVCQVLGFRDKKAAKGSKNRTFKGFYCPVKHTSGLGRGVEMLCNFFNVEERLTNTGTKVRVLMWSGNTQKYVDIEHYKSHINLNRDLGSEELVLLEEN